ncbi:preprotein translocase subunit SecE [uncultured Propionibacterium sp.]|uniref:preprotein translocase subunit SecE n=1 Tax=uncultured Propionibacterium sp. TaxID=218066 RepID=UPI0029308A2B|nr:preprotein translocase subunit SecE [uncultured Propionibacterium sp.]
MVDESTRTDDAADADGREPRNGRSGSGGAVGARRARRGLERAGRPKRRPAGADGDGPAKAIERRHTTAPTRRAGGAERKRTKEPARRRRTTPWGFAKQSVDELKRVIWPSGQEVSQYFVVVLAFVVFIMAIVAGLDLGFTRLLLRLFG